MPTIHILTLEANCLCNQFFYIIPDSLQSESTAARSLKCAFWNNKVEPPTWSTDGVTTEFILNRSKVLCRSQHLTNFAVIGVIIILVFD
jgi:GPCR proteolysis site, GPS, motif